MEIYILCNELHLTQRRFRRVRFQLRDNHIIKSDYMLGYNIILVEVNLELLAEEVEINKWRFQFEMDTT